MQEDEILYWLLHADGRGGSVGYSEGPYRSRTGPRWETRCIKDSDGWQRVPVCWRDKAGRVNISGRMAVRLQ